MTSLFKRSQVFSLITASLAMASFARADLNPHTIADPLAAEAATLTSGFFPISNPAPVDPTGQGAWGPVIPWTPHIPVTAATLPDGRLLTFSSNKRTSFPLGPEFTYTAIWDPATGLFSGDINNVRHDMFCGGTAMLPDGRVVVSGGRNASVLSSVFDFRTNEWTALQSMADGRWYNTNVALPDGSVFTVGGTVSETSGGHRTAELWNSVTGWRRLTGIPWLNVLNQPGYTNFWHPFLMVAPNGKMLHFGPTDQMNWVTTNNTGTLVPSGQNVPGAHYPKESAWAMFDEGKILVAGGGADTTANLFDSSTGTSTTAAYTIDLNGTTPVVAPAAPMINPRQLANTVVLPNGEVMVIGGNTSGLKFSDVGSILIPELWNPRTGTWRALTAMDIPRNYHSVALLLPDGRVWSGGGGLSATVATNHQDAQIFTPPALFAPNGSLALRPVITQAPTLIGPNNTFTVLATPGIRKFAFIRMSSVSHSVNTDLRYLSVPFVENTPGVYTLTSHSSSNVLMPGYWMLFALDAQSVHSVSKIIQVAHSSALSITNPGDQLPIQGRPVSLPVSTSISPGTTVTYSATGLPGGLSINPTTGIISGTTNAPVGNYWSSVMATPNTGGAVTISFNWNVLLANLGTGTIFSELWFIPPIENININNPAARPLYPDRATERDQLLSFEVPADLGDNLIRRIRGYVHPPVTGSYRFSIASDGESRLLLSTNSNPANAVQIASNDAFPVLPRQWNQNLAQTSTYFTLQAGQKYYIEALMKEDTGPDHLAVAWSLPNSLDLSVISGQFLSPFDPVGSFTAAWYLDEKNWNGTAGEAKVSAPFISGVNGSAQGGAVTSNTGPVFAGNPGTGSFGRFDGANDCVSVPYNPALNPNDFTISAWVRLRTATGSWRSVATSRESTGGNFRGFGLYATGDGKWMFLTGTNWTALTGPDVVAEQWTHVAASFRTVDTGGFTRNGIRTLYVNGVLVAQDWGSYVPPSTGPLFIGAASSSGGAGDFMGGDIDEVRLYPAALGANDLVPIMNLRRSVASSPVVVNPGPIANARNSNISRTIQASDGSNNPMTFSATGLPTGLTISTNTGIISGSPNTLGNFNVVITASNSGGDSGTASFAWSIVENLTVTPVNSPPSPSPGLKSFTASSTGGSNVQFRWNFGDGSPETALSGSPNASYTFPGPGRYLVTVTATDDSGAIVTGSFYLALHAPLAANAPTNSSAISYERRNSGGDRVWVVNPDNNSVSVLDATTGNRLAEIPVGLSPRCVAVAPDGRIWVSNADAATLSIIDPQSLTIVQAVTLPRGSRPFGLAFAPTADALWVVLENSGRVLELDPTTGAELANIAVGPNVRHLSISSDGTRVFVSRFITPPLTGESTAVVNTTGQGGEVVVINSATNTILQTVILAHSEDPDTSNSSKGIPNYLGAATISPDGLSAWVPSKKDNIKRGILRNNQDLTHDMSVRAIASRINLTTMAEDLPGRVDMDNSGMPSAIAYDPQGIYAFVALEANRAIIVIDIWNKTEIMRFNAGRAPQGLTVSRDGRRLFVHNFMDRTVSIHNVGSLIDGLTTPIPPSVTVSTITTENLTAPILTGKQLFYDAKDNRVAFQEYISCASCHNDGDQDGRVWDFTGFGEGLRNTISLRGHGGTAQGPLHWTGNFDEVQDFEAQIRFLAGGSGLIANGSPHPPLGTPNAGRSADLDALAAYVQSLGRDDPSPHRPSAGTLTPSAAAGETIFRTMDCASCHGGPEFTLSSLGNLPNIGTLKTSSGKRLNATLTGMDIPTLRGAWATAPYLHDGSAATLQQAISAHQGVSLNSTDLDNLVAYIRSVDDLPLSAPLPKTQFTGWAEVTPGTDGNPASNADGDLLPDLLEYSLDGVPNSGAFPASDALTLEQLPGSVALLVRRPVGLTDVTYEAMTSPDLVSWTASSINSVQAPVNGIEVARFDNIQSRPGLSLDSGFVRLRVTRNGLSQVTLPLGWQGISLGAASRTLGVPFRETPIFSSGVTGVSGNKILVNGTPSVPPGFRGFVEISSGAAAGNRFEYAASTAGEITIAPASLLNTLAVLPNLTGAQIVLAAHHALAGVFAKSLFKGSTDPGAADQVQFYSNNGTTGRFDLFYLLDARPRFSTYQWRAFMPGGGDQDGRVIAPGEGMLLKRPPAAPSSRLVMQGQVRANPFIQPLKAGLNLLGSPFPIAASPASRGLLDPLAAFVPSTAVELADQIHLYQNNAFRVFYFLDHPTLADQWREVIPNSPDSNGVSIFNPTEAAFFKRTNPSASYRVPLLWTP